MIRTMTMNRCGHFILTLTLCAVPAAELCAAATGSGAAAVEQQFSARIRAALASPDSADEIALAEEMTKAAKETPVSSSDLIAALTERAFAIATKTAAGDEVGVQALRLLMQRVPEKKIEAAEQIATLRQKRYQAAVKAADKSSLGDLYIDALLEAAESLTWAEKYPEAEAKLKAAGRVAAAIRSTKSGAIEFASAKCAARKVLMTKLRGLEKQLAAQPSDAKTADDIVKLYVVDLDDPATAMKYTAKGSRAEDRRLAPLALKPVEQMGEADALALGNWYRAWAQQADATCIAPILLRGYNYYERFLKLHKVQDVKRHEAQTGQKEVELLMARHNVPLPLAEMDRPKLDPTAVMAGLPQANDAGNKLTDALQAPLDMRKDAENPSVWADLLKLIRADRQMIMGQWKQQGTEGIGGAFAESYARLVLPLRIKGSYELQVGFRINSGSGKLMISLPVETQRVAMVFDTTDARKCGLESVDGKSASASGTLLKPMDIKPGQEYTIRFTIEVKDGSEATIKAVLNGVNYLAWSGLVNALTTPAAWDIPKAHQPGLGAHPAGIGDTVDVVFNHIKFRVLNGEAETVVGTE